jgi:hypothetical protein
MKPLYIDWGKTVGVYLLGERFLPFCRDVRLFRILLAGACVGAVVIFTSWYKAIGPMWALLGVAIGMPHMVYDVLLWQQVIATQLMLSATAVTIMLNNILFLTMTVLLCTRLDDALSAVPLMAAALMVALSNTCVFFYDAIHPVIAKKALGVALGVLFCIGSFVVYSIFADNVILPDVVLPLGGFEVNAKSLMFGCLQNMIVMWLLQLFKLSSSPLSLKVLQSGVEIQTVSRQTYQHARRVTMKAQRSQRKLEI